jgi:hypothetical protein
MICVYHLPGPRHGLHHSDIRFWMNGGLGSLTPKLLGKIHYLHSICFNVKCFQYKAKNEKCVDDGNSQILEKFEEGFNIKNSFTSKQTKF